MTAMPFQPLAVSHIASASSVGDGIGALLSALREARSGLKPCEFETVALPTCIGQVDQVDHVRLPPEVAAYDCRNNRLAYLALRADGFAAAVAEARAKYGPTRIGMVLGTSTSGIHETERAYRDRDPLTGAFRRRFDFARTHDMYSVARFAATCLGVEGPASVVSAACSTTANAFGCGARMIAAGLCDAVIVGGADSLCLTTLYGFNSLEILSSAPCRPFDAERNGISIGEAAGFALLEKPEAAMKEDSVLLLGVGESSEAHHMSAPHPSGKGARMAMERALSAAGLRPEDIDYVNVHGTGTRIGDAAEDAALVSLFGGRTACSSTKGYIGHTLGAAGISEAIISILALRYGFIPGGLNTRTVDAAFSSRYLTRTTDAPLARVMSNSLGFGGVNCSLIFGRS